MAELQKYEGVGEIYVNARLLAEASKVEVTITSNDQKVMTMKKGMAGFSDGPTETTISIESAIPRKGFESDFVTAVTQKKPVRITVKSGGKRITVNGRFTEARFNNQVDSPAMLSGSVSGGAPEILG
jgi:hypothetical protein